MPTLPDPVDFAVPGFVLLVLAEMLVARVKDRRRYCPRDTLTSLMLGFGSTVAGALSAGALYALADWTHQFRLFDIGYVWWAWPLCFVRATWPITPFTGRRTACAGSGPAT